MIYLTDEERNLLELAARASSAGLGDIEGIYGFMLRETTPSIEDMQAGMAELDDAWPTLEGTIPATCPQCADMGRRLVWENGVAVERDCDECGGERCAE